jgi:citrate synthase
MWLSAEEALARLRVKPQTLYANVSRGRVRAKADPADPRRSLYRAEDVERLVRRAAGRPRTAEVARDTIRWGDPILPSAISTILDGRLYYRGADAVALSERAALEDAASLLWQLETRVAAVSRDDASRDGRGLAPLFATLAARAATDLPSYGRSAAALRADAVSVFATIAQVICGAGDGPVHQRLAARWRRPDAADVLRRALVLLADHELNASTFAARVAVSTGASLASGALAGLATLSGPLHGTAALAVQGLVARAAVVGAAAALRERLAEGRPVPAFGHRLYPAGDARAAALLADIGPPPLYEAIAAEARELLGEAPNVDFALAALTAAFGLPESAAVTVFALARSVGWLAHMLEQAASGHLIRPRAQYVGDPPIRAGDTEIPQNRAFPALK